MGTRHRGVTRERLVEILRARPKGTSARQLGKELLVSAVTVRTALQEAADHGQAVYDHSKRLTGGWFPVNQEPRQQSNGAPKGVDHARRVKEQNLEIERLHRQATAMAQDIVELRGQLEEASQIAATHQRRADDFEATIRTLRVERAKLQTALDTRRNRVAELERQVMSKGAPKPEPKPERERTEVQRLMAQADLLIIQALVDKLSGMGPK